MSTAARCESGCGRCVFFAVDHADTLCGWAWMLIRFAWHRISGDCRRLRHASSTAREFIWALQQDTSACTGDVATCPVEECIACGARDCPHGEPLHYHHDGCPACYVEEKNQ